MHIIFSIYKDEYLGKEILSKQDEELLRRAVAGELNDKVVDKVEACKDKMLLLKISESKKNGYKDEWFEFQDEENVYEETLQASESPRDWGSPSLKSPDKLDLEDHLKFGEESDHEERQSKATMGFKNALACDLGSPVDKQLEDLGADEEDTELERQLSNRYHNKMHPPLSDTHNKLPTMNARVMGSAPCIREAKDAIASVKNKLQLNKLRINIEE